MTRACRDDLSEIEALHSLRPSCAHCKTVALEKISPRIPSLNAIRDRNSLHDARGEDRRSSTIRFWRGALIPFS